MEVAPSQMEVAPFQMEVAPFFVDFHHFLSIFTIFYRFSRFTHFCRDLHFVAIYALFPQFFFWPKQPSPHHHTFFACMFLPHEIISFRRKKIQLKSETPKFHKGGPLQTWLNATRPTKRFKSQTLFYSIPVFRYAQIGWFNRVNLI